MLSWIRPSAEWRAGRADRTEARLAGVSLRFTAVIVASALFMEQLDGTVLATALPTMARSFGVAPLEMNVALTAYLLSLAVFIPVSGKAADRFGTRTVFRAAIALFTVGSILCGQADSLGLLVGARILQGIGGAMMVPVGRLVILRTVAKRDMVTVMSWLMVTALLGPIAGPPVGGFFVTYLSWRWIFYINVPIGVLGMILVSRYVRDVRSTEPVLFDGLGVLFSAVALSCLMFGLELASRGVIGIAATAAVLATGVASGVLYVRHSRAHTQPVLDFTLMRIPTFRLSVIGGAFTRVGMGALPFLLPMFLQLGFGMSAAQSGLVTFISAVGSMVMKFTARPILHRWGFRRVMMWNGATATLFLAVISAFRPSWPLAVLYGVLLVGGFFQSLQFTAYNTIAYADIPRSRMSAATSFYTTFQQLMLTLGISVAAASLAGSLAVTGHSQPLLADFSLAFLIVAAVSLLAAPACARLPRDAGDELSGRAPPVAEMEHAGAMAGADSPASARSGAARHDVAAPAAD